MKFTQYMLLLILGLTIGAAQSSQSASFRMQSYYGFTGLMFIPTAQTMATDHWGLSYSAKPNAGSDLLLEPFSVRFIYGPSISEGLEVAVTNTPVYASNREFGGVSIINGLPDVSMAAPIFLSVKYQFMPMIRANHHVGMAAGFSLPYGAYYVVDKFIDAKIMDVTVHTGVATKLTTYHAFLGTTWTFGKRTGETQRDFPVELLLEGAWGGSLKQLNEKEEAFWAVSLRYAWTSSLRIVTFLRIDNQALLEEDLIVSDSPTKRMGIGLDFVWQ